MLHKPNKDELYTSFRPHPLILFGYCCSDNALSQKQNLINITGIVMFRYFIQKKRFLPKCTMNPGGYSVKVKNGYSNISKVLLFIDGRKIAPPPLPTLPVNAFRDPPENTNN